MYCYNNAKGEVFSNVINLSLFKFFLEYCEKFWKKKKLGPNSRLNFKKNCHQFYYEKTIQRIKQFYKNFNKKDCTQIINGTKMPKLSNLLRKVDWSDLADGCPGRFHGDFHFENILWNQKKKKFTFLDWRQDFNGNIYVGDIYYDLAKLLHGMIVSHEIVQKNQFYVEWDENQIFYKIKKKQEFIKIENHFNNWCIKKGYSLTKVRILTAIIFLNIAALHHYPYSLLLYALGKDMLNKELDNK